MIKLVDQRTGEVYWHHWPNDSDVRFSQVRVGSLISQPSQFDAPLVFVGNAVIVRYGIRQMYRTLFAMLIPLSLVFAFAYYAYVKKSVSPKLRIVSCVLLLVNISLFVKLTSPFFGPVYILAFAVIILGCCILRSNNKGKSIANLRLEGVLLLLVQPLWVFLLL